MNIFTKIGKFLSGVKLPKEEKGQGVLVLFLGLIGLALLPFTLAFFLIRFTHNRVNNNALRNSSIALITFFALFIGSAWVAAMVSPTSPEESTTVATESQTEKQVAAAGKAVAPQKESSTREEVAKTPSAKNNASEQSTTPENGTSQNTEEEQVEGLRTNTYSVHGVVDGDTAKLLMDGVVKTVRLIGLDTPETVHPTKPVQCFGVEASNKAKQLLEGKQVRFEVDISQGTQDRYGRLLGYIILPDGRNFNKVMIEEGYGYEYTYSAPYKYQSAFKAAQASAESNKRGLWSPGVCAESEGTEDPNVQQEPTPEPEPEPEPEQSSGSGGGKWYTSAYHSTKYYYHESCDGWQGIVEENLRVYYSEAAVQAAHPDHTLHHECSI